MKQSKEEKKKFQKIILTYANNSLLENPENLYKVFEEIKDSKFHLTNYFTIGLIMNAIKALGEKNDSTVVDDYRKELPLKLWKKFYPDKKPPNNLSLIKKRIDPDFFNDHEKALEIAVEEVYGYINSPCPCNIYREETIGKNRFSGPDRLKCYECDQLYFNYLLEKIASGEPYKNISGFEDLVRNFHINKIAEVVFGKDNEILIQSELSSGYGENFKAFPKILDGMMSNVLIDYLSSPGNDRNLLKKCFHCGNFYFAEELDTDNTFCSKKCAEDHSA